MEDYADTIQTEAESMDYSDYWNDIASDGEADQNALDSAYGPGEDSENEGFYSDEPGYYEAYFSEY
jgi:hypothetical protein